jgi:hypothetical protein
MRRLDRPLAARRRRVARDRGDRGALLVAGGGRQAARRALLRDRAHGRVREGRLFAVSLLVERAGPPAAVSALVALRAPPRGDERGAPLGC